MPFNASVTRGASRGAPFCSRRAAALLVPAAAERAPRSPKHQDAGAARRRARARAHARRQRLQRAPGSSSTAAGTASSRPRSCACATPPTCAPSCAGPTATTSRSSRAPAATATAATRPATRAVVVDLGAARLHPLRRRDRDDRPGRAARRRLRARSPRRGVTIPAGSCPTVAIGGLVLGGGMGLAGPRDGAHARPRARASTSSPPTAERRRVDDGDDLFWALRGGGGSFAHRHRRSACAPARVEHAPRSSASPTRAARATRRSRDWDAFAPHGARAS